MIVYDIWRLKKFNTDKNLLISELFTSVSHTKSKMIPNLDSSHCGTLTDIASRPFG